MPVAESVQQLGGVNPEAWAVVADRFGAGSLDPFDPPQPDEARYYGSAPAVVVDAMGDSSLTAPLRIEVDDVYVRSRLSRATVVIVDYPTPRLAGVSKSVDQERADITQAEASLGERVRLSSSIGGMAIEHANVVRLDQMEGDRETQEEYARLVGSVALGGRSERTENNKPERSCLDLLRGAAAGKQEDFDALLSENITHDWEMRGGVGKSKTIRLGLNENSEVIWGNQTTKQRQINMFQAYPDQAPGIRAGAHAENLTGLRLEDRFRDGQLRGKRVIEFSPVQDGSWKELVEANFLLNSMSVFMRDTIFDEEARVCEMTTTTLAGVDQREVEPGYGESREQEEARQRKALEISFDAEVLGEMYEEDLGVEGAKNMTRAELLGTAIVVDAAFTRAHMAMLYDSHATRRMSLGEQTFCGSVKLWQEIGSPEVVTLEHYQEYFAQDEARSEQDKERAIEITKRQVQLQHLATTPAEAVALKSKVVLAVTVEGAIDDTSFDATRLGRKAAAKINGARWKRSQGDEEGALALVEEAKDDAIDPTCPTGARDKANKKKDDKGEECNEVNDGDEVTCPYCGKEVTAIVPEKGGTIFCSNDSCTASYKKAKK